jgi:murein DD-endopeptidase MepM/ murein hydrolase activator NlpD
MREKRDTFLGSAGFFVAVGVCLLAAVACWLMLTGRDDAPAAAETASIREEAVPVQERLPVQAKPPVVEVLAPEAVEEPAPMPEIEVDDTPVIAEAPRLIVTPVHGEVLMAFSMEELTYNPTMEDWRTHNGIDIAAASGTTVLAACNGQVLAVEEDALMGTTVVLEHDGGYQTTYANLQVSPPVTAGDFVSAGQIIGAVGATAAAESAQESHLHFAVTKDGESIDPHTFLDE